MLQKILLVRDFFPFVLIKAQIKFNFFGLLYWALLFSILFEVFGASFGVPFLFYSPEYLGEVGLWSFALLGFSLGGFSMAFNVYSYIKLGPRFPFLVVVSTPFFRFCINNFILPFAYILAYLIKMSKFQLYEEFASTSDVLIYNISFMIGFLLFILLSILYFFPLRTNKDADDSISESNPVSTITSKGIGQKWYNYFREKRTRPVYYLGRKFKLYKSRSVAHLDKAVVESVFSKTRINAFIFEVLTITAFISLGFFRNISLFEVPAAMSILMLLTILSMVIGALNSWFHRWTYPLVFLVIIIMSILSSKVGFFRYTSYALGLDYSTKSIINYSPDNIRDNHKLIGENTSSDQRIIEILENWKARTGEEKPKLVILNTSGGGLRSALWTFTVLSNADEKLNSKLSKYLQMITGASGGMVGAAYFREIYLRKKLKTLKGDNTFFKTRLSRDLLNRLSFSASTSDLFMRYKKIKYNGKSYTQERGSEFETELHQNLQNYLEHPLGYYEKYEKQSDIPLMIFSPTIVNDGRRMLISSQNLSFMIGDDEKTTFENIDFQSFFRNNNPQEIRFSSVLRANATFPMIMPMMGMPTKPEIQLMDAGIRDNYGGKVSLDYLFALSDWIIENTSGVVIIEVRDTKRIMSNEVYKELSLIDKIFLPFGNLLTNFTRTQDLDQEQLMKMCKGSFKFPVDKITFNLREDFNERISLSWHLTKREKQKIEAAFTSPENQMALKKLNGLMSNQ
tara:strand:- start:5053 stop:7266 length:2214 start_codon:yes stop_codon:yes gene_type:complete